MIKIVENHIKENIKEYTILLLIFIIGLIIGTITLNNSGETQSSEISEYLNSFTAKVQEGSKIDYSYMIVSIMKKNISIVVIMTLLGVSIIGMPALYLFIGYKGFCVGYTISSAIAVLGTFKGLLLTLSLMFLSKIIELPALFLIAVSSLKMLKSIIKDKRKENIKYEGIRFIMQILISLILLTFSALIETYLSSNLFINIAKFL